MGTTNEYLQKSCFLIYYSLKLLGKQVEVLDIIIKRKNKNIYRVAILFLGVMISGQNLSAQEATLPDSFLYKINQCNLDFSLSGEVEEKMLARKENARIAGQNNCASVYYFKPDLTVSIGKKKELNLVYKVVSTPITNDSNKIKAYEEFLPVAFGLYNAGLQENDDLGTELSLIDSIERDIHADIVEIGTFSLNKEVQKCIRHDTYVHLMAYKKGRGYFHILLFYNKEEYKDFKRLLATALRSLKFNE